MKIKRRNYLIDKKFQLAFAGNMVILLLIGVLVTGFFVSWFCLVAVDERILCSSQSLLMYQIAIILLFMAVGVGIWAILHTHSVAGPAYKASRILRDAARGKLPEGPVTFRKNDALKATGEH